jgi:hypothetical protein
MTESTAQARTHFIERIGMHPELAIGYLGLLLFMIGDGVEAGFLSPLLVDLWSTLRHLRAQESDVGRPAHLARL